MGRCGRGWLIAGIVLLRGASAWAGDAKAPFPPCTTTPTDADRKAAQGAFAAGHGSFNEADYSTAITYWRDAYRRDCTAHLLLLNLARAYELQGERVDAVSALQTYLDRKPDAPDADQIRRRIENLKSQVAAAPPPVAAPPPAPAPAPVPVTPLPAETSLGDTSASRSVVPLVVAGAGGVVAIAGAIVLVGGAGKVSDAENACPTRIDCAKSITDKGNQGRKQENAGGIVLGAGAAIAVGSIVWYFVSTPSGRTANRVRAPTIAHTDITPIFTAGYAGLTLSSTF